MYQALTSLFTCMSSLISHEMNVFLDSDTSSVVVNTIEPLALSFIERRDPAVRPISFSFRFLSYLILRSRRLEEVGERENGYAPVFSCAHHFQRRLILSVHLITTDCLADNKNFSLVGALSPAAGVKFSRSVRRDERQRRA